MKCTDDEYRIRSHDTNNISIKDLILQDKENYFEESKMFSNLEGLFTSLLEFAKDDTKECNEYVKIGDSLDVVISFLKQYDIDMYYRFMGVLSNKQIHFISYDDLAEEISLLFDYIYNIVKNTDFTSCEVLNTISDIIYDNVYDSTLYKYLTFLNIDINEIITYFAFIDDYESFKDGYISNIIKNSNITSYITDEEIVICYNNTIKDAFDILHEFIHLDNLCPGNVVHYNEKINFGDYKANRPYNFFFNEIPSIMMESELFDYLINNYSYDLSFYLPYRIGLKEDEIRGIYLPFMSDDINIYDEYLDFVRDLLNSSENYSLMYMMTYEQDNFDNVYLSYILGIIVSMYAMTLNKEDRANIFNYIRSRITSDDNYFMMFKSIGLDILNSKDMDKLVSSLYDRYDSMNKCLVKKK